MTSQQAKKLRTLFSSPQKIVIVTHWSPDGDAMGSSLGLYNFLIKKKHKVKVITPNDYPHFLHWLPGNQYVLDNSLKPKEAARFVAEAGIVFCLDFNSIKRIDKLGEHIEKSKAIKILIDHHPDPDNFAHYALHDVKASSTAELVYDFIALLGETKLIDQSIADCLYTGIMTDTGSFRFPSTTAKTHRITAQLIEAGANNSGVYERVFDDNTEDKIKLQGYSLLNLVVLKQYNAAYLSLSSKELKKFNFRKGDTEGLVNYALSIRGVKFSVFFVERDGMVKASFRSKGTFDVNKFARAHFSGGGHRNAAGGSSDLSLTKTVNKFLKVLPLFKNELTTS